VQLAAAWLGLGDEIGASLWGWEPDFNAAQVLLRVVEGQRATMEGLCTLLEKRLAGYQA
jgi:hypothetical protein